MDAFALDLFSYQVYLISNFGKMLSLELLQRYFLFENSLMVSQKPLHGSVETVLIATVCSASIC